MNLHGKRLILASASPRRAQLLRLVGLDFEIVASEIAENEETYTFPEIHVLELSQEKAVAVAQSVSEGVIVGADTIVVLGDRILGKPKNKNAARSMLRQLSGRKHDVYTGFTLVNEPGGATYSDYERTEVSFRELTDEDIDQYVATGAPMDKAGAYGIQDQSAHFVERINGCFYNVVGLPLAKFCLAIRSFLARSDQQHGREALT